MVFSMHLGRFHQVCRWPQASGCGKCKHKFQKGLIYFGRCVDDIAAIQEPAVETFPQQHWAKAIPCKVVAAGLHASRDVCPAKQPQLSEPHADQAEMPLAPAIPAYILGNRRIRLRPERCISRLCSLVRIKVLSAETIS